jgi:hypothetical protein
MAAKQWPNDMNTCPFTQVAACFWNNLMASKLRARCNRTATKLEPKLAGYRSQRLL